MCLCIDTDKKIRTAARDMIVYKRLRRAYSWERGKGNPNVFKAPYRSAMYILGRQKTVKNFTGTVFTPGSYKAISFSDTFPKDLLRIHKGLHAFKTLKAARARDFGSVIVRCIIPKGTHYVNGADGEIVTLSLIPKKVVS